MKNIIISSAFQDIKLSVQIDTSLLVKDGHRSVIQKSESVSLSLKQSSPFSQA